MFRNYIETLYYYSNIQKLPEFLYSMSLKEFFDYMKNVKYKKQIFESIDREPLDIIINGGDCGEKVKCCMIYFNDKGLDYDVIFLKSGFNLFHVFNRVYIAGDAIDFDVAMGDLNLGERYNLNEVARFEIRKR